MRLFALLVLSFTFLTTPLICMQVDEESSSRTKRAPSLKSAPYATQEKVNETVIPIATTAYERMSKNWTYVPPKTHMSTDSEFWVAKIITKTFIKGTEVVSLPGPTLVHKTGPLNLSRDLKDLMDKPAVVECTIAMTVAQICCLVELLGEENFHIYASGIYAFLQKTPGRSTDEFFYELPNFFITRQEGQPVPGSFVYIPNIGLYTKYKPNGNAAAENAFYVGRNKYVCFKPGKLRTLSREDILSGLLEDFKRAEDAEAEKAEHRVLSSIFTSAPLVYYNVQRADQETCNVYDIFSLEQVNLILQRK